MKKLFLILLAVLIITSCGAFAAKFTVNQSGVVKSKGQVLSPTSNIVNQNVYNNYQHQEYVAKNMVNQSQVEIIEIVMDYSGSMANWIGVAKRSMASIVAQISPSVRLGFRVFGHDNHGNNPSINATLQEVKSIVKKGNKIKVVTEMSPIGKTTGGCAATEQVSPIYSANAQTLLRGMNSVDIGGSTPMVYALDRTINQDFANLDMTTPKKIVLITDGGENCGGDPCEFVRRLVAKRSDVHIDVVLVSSSSKALSCLSTTTGGHFYNINNLSDFSTTINQSINTTPGPVMHTPSDQQNDEQHYEFIRE